MRKLVLNEQFEFRETYPGYMELYCNECNKAFVDCKHCDWVLKQSNTLKALTEMLTESVIKKIKFMHNGQLIYSYKVK